jgi:hypothetical protein
MKNNRFSESFAKADATFNGLYSVELKQLKGLSKDEISAIVPSADNLQVYQSLINVIEKASKDNLSQAQLISNIKGLGDKAVKIAKKLPCFVMLL